MPPDGLTQNGGANLAQDPVLQAQSLNSAIAYVRQEAKTAIDDVKADAKEQKSYLLLGFFLLGVMVATMILMVVGMLYGVLLDQNTQTAQLDADIKILLGKMK